MADDPSARHSHESGVDEPHGPAAAVFATSGGENLEQRIQLLEEQQARQTRALRLLIEGRWTGAMPHAAAEVDALLGGNVQGFEPVAFPKDEGQ